MEKHGFVYIWYDRKHKRYYVGSHWGTIDDGYICSSPWMKQAYKRRPQDFKRRILSYVYTNRKDLYECETRFLQMIREDEIKVRYYNLNIRGAAHWSANEDKRLSIGEKISLAHSKPEVKKKLSESKMGDKNPMKRKEVSEKVAKKNKGRVAPNKGISNTEEQKRKQSQTMKKRYEEGLEVWNKGTKITGVILENMTKANRKMSEEKTWYCNKETGAMVRINNNEVPPEGFVRGRIGYKQSLETRQRKSESLKGIRKKNKYWWITNGKENQRLLQGSEIPPGWKRGRVL